MLEEEKNQLEEYLDKKLKHTEKYVHEEVMWIEKVLESAKIKTATNDEELKLCMKTLPDGCKESYSRRHFHKAAMRNYMRFLHETGKIKSETTLINYLMAEEQKIIDKYVEWLEKLGYSNSKVVELKRHATKYFCANRLSNNSLNREFILEYQNKFPDRKMELSAFIRFLEQTKVISSAAFKSLTADPSLGIPPEMEDLLRQFIESFRNRFNPTWASSTWGLLVHFGAFLTEKKIVSLLDVHRTTITEFLRTYHDRNLTPGYINDIADAIFQLYDWGAEEYGWRIQPVSKKCHYAKMGTHLPRPLNDCAVKQIEAKLPDTWFRTAFYFGLEAGFRAMDVVNLELDDIDLNLKQIRVEKSKGIKDRIVYISDDLEREIRRWLEIRPNVEGCKLMFHHHGIKYCYGAIDDCVTRIRKSCGASFTFHQLRHTFCTRLHRNGMRLEHMMQLMGHSNPMTTLLYTKIYPTDLRMAFFSAKEKEKENQIKEDIQPTEIGTIRDLKEMVDRGEFNVEILS